MYDVITVGSATVDVFAKTNFSELIKILKPTGETDLLAYPVGAKILVDVFEFTIGGGGTNSAVALARLGHKVAWLGKLGNDENADKVINTLKKEKVDILATKSQGYTGFSVILDSIEHDRTILAYKGANDNLSFAEINLRKLNTKWFYFSSMMGKSFITLKGLAKFAENHNIKILFNPSEYLAKRGINYLESILKRSSLIILNKEEAFLLTNSNKINSALKLLSKYSKIVVITDGKNPVHCFDGYYLYKARPSRIKVVETTGAGDAFAASFLSGLLKKNSIEFAIKLAITNAESVISYHGAKNRLLRYREALAIMKKRPIKVIKKKL